MNLNERRRNISEGLEASTVAAAKINDESLLLAGILGSNTSIALTLIHVMEILDELSRRVAELANAGRSELPSSEGSSPSVATSVENRPEWAE